MAGGAEALVHTHEAIESTVRANPDLGIWVAIDVVFQNAFPLMSHEATESALEARVTHLRPWSKCCQDNCGVFFFNSVTSTKLDEVLNKATHWYLYNVAAS